MDPHDNIVTSGEGKVFKSESLGHKIDIAERAKGVTKSSPSWVSGERGSIDLHAN